MKLGQFHTLLYLFIKLLGPISSHPSLSVAARALGASEVANPPSTATNQGTASSTMTAAKHASRTPALLHGASRVAAWAALLAAALLATLAPCVHGAVTKRNYTIGGAQYTIGVLTVSPNAGAVLGTAAGSSGP